MSNVFASLFLLSQKKKCRPCNKTFTHWRERLKRPARTPIVSQEGLFPMLKPSASRPQAKPTRPPRRRIAAGAFFIRYASPARHEPMPCMPDPPRPRPGAGRHLGRSQSGIGPHCGEAGVSPGGQVYRGGTGRKMQNVLKCFILLAFFRPEAYTETGIPP